MPSSWKMSSTRMADDSATSASRANKSHDVRIVLSMFANGRNECGESRRCGRWWWRGQAIWVRQAPFHEERRAD
jgi:hypothetical protein